MTEVVFMIRGQRVEPREMQKRVERVVLEEVEHNLKLRLTGVHCSEHDAGPRITVTGDVVDDLAFDLSGCCQNLMDKVVEALR